MKRFLTVVAICITFTGCASSPKITFESAKNNCVSAGFKPGTDAIMQCIAHQMNQNNQLSFTQQYMLNRASNPGLMQDSSPLPITTQCSRTGSYVNCQTSRF